MASFLRAQNVSDTIAISRSGVMTHEGVRLTPTKLKSLALQIPAAKEEYKKAEVNYYIAYVLSTAGGALIGYPVGTKLAGGNPNWNIAAAGAVILVPAVFFAVDYNKRAKRAVRIINDELKQSGKSVTYLDLKVGPTSNGIGITINF